MYVFLYTAEEARIAHAHRFDVALLLETHSLAVCVCVCG